MNMGSHHFGEMWFESINVMNNGPLLVEVVELPISYMPLMPSFDICSEHLVDFVVNRELELVLCWKVLMQGFSPYSHALFWYF